MISQTFIREVLDSIVASFELRGIEVSGRGCFQDYNPYGEIDFYLRTKVNIEFENNSVFLSALEDLWLIEPKLTVEFEKTCVNTDVFLLLPKGILRICRQFKLLYIQRYLKSFTDTPSRIQEKLPEGALVRIPPGKVVFYAGKDFKELHQVLSNLGFVSQDKLHSRWVNSKGEWIHIEGREQGFKLNFTKLLPRL